MGIWGNKDGGAQVTVLWGTAAGDTEEWEYKGTGGWGIGVWGRGL